MGVQSNCKEITDEVLVCLRKIIQAIELHSKFLIREVGLTGPQLLILYELSDSRELTVGELAKAVSLSQATLTGILERLEKRDLIARRRDLVDRRKVMIKATPACHELLLKAPPLMQQSFVQAFGSLQHWEQTMILSSLQRLVFMMGAGGVPAAPILTTDNL